MKKSAPASASTLHPSFPNAFKSKLYLEIDGWDAHLKIDHDAGNPFSLPRLGKTRRLIETLAAPVRDVSIYTTAKGHHVRIWLRTEYPIHARIVLRLQVELGDDPKRAEFNTARVARGEPGWNVLWNRKIRNGKIAMVEELDAGLTAQARKLLVS